mmetsp:Transcript_66533/g.110629  ORF Transcript_66533/g.110629 Transcript_66533/m.110629 type:complete len:506 (-) Transcript_66533:373-1890(-)
MQRVPNDDALDVASSCGTPSSLPPTKPFWEKVAQLLYAPRELFFIFSIKFAESTAYFAFSYIYAQYLSDEFGFSDIEAGILYGLYGLLCSVFGLIAGPAIDALDLRSALLLGTIPSFIARCGSALSREPRFIAFCSVSLLPLGAAFGLPVFALGVRRYTHPENRAFAFTVFYAVLCASSAAGGLVISVVRAKFHDGLQLFGRDLSWMRVNVLCCAFLTLYTCLISLFVRPLRVQQGVQLEEAKLEPVPKQDGGLHATLRVVYGSKPFWKLLGLSLIVSVGTRATFRHLDATFPKYFVRMFGEDAPFEVFVAVEPVLTVLLSFPVTYLLLRHRIPTYVCLIGGTLVQSFCPLALTYTSYISNLGFVSVMALGEAIWSPRLYEYSTMVAPEGFEGTFVAVTFVPQYVSAAVVGATSGVLLDTYVPETLEPGEERHPEKLWGLVAAAAFVSPVLLWLGKRRLFGDEPELQHAVAAVPQATEEDEAYEMVAITKEQDAAREEQNGMLCG